MLTFLAIEQIEEMAAWDGSRINEAKKILAYELTDLVHGEEEAKEAEKAAQVLFVGTVDSSSEFIPTVTVTDDDMTDGCIDILALLQKAELVKTRSEARRAVDQGGVTVNGEKITDIKTAYKAEDFGDGLMLRKGKKSYKKAVFG
jgi:tyrosyl-tRNA synthetase